MPKATTKLDWKIAVTDTYGPTSIVAKLDGVQFIVVVSGFKWRMRIFMDDLLAFETNHIYTTATAAILFAEFVWNNMLSKKTTEQVKEMNDKYFRGRK